MPSYTQPPYLLEEVRVEYCTEPDPGILAREAPAVYRPRHAEATVFYQTFEQHFDSYVRAYEDRFEARSGPLRRVVLACWIDLMSREGSPAALANRLTPTIGLCA